MMRRRRVHLALGFLLFTAVFLAGCGGGGATGPKTITLTSNASLDGIITKDVLTASYSKKMDEIEAKTGSQYAVLYLPPELGGTLEIRSHHRILFSFDLAALAGATIQSANVRFYFDRVEGNPVVNCGVVIIDHVYYGADLTDPAALYGGYCITPDIGFTGGELSPGGWISTDVTGLVQDDVDAGRSSSQYRLYHSTELAGSFTASQLSFWSSGDSATNHPELIVTYTK